MDFLENLKTILSSPFVNLIGIFLGILGPITGYWFYKKGLRTKEPCYSIRNIKIIQGFASTVEGLEVNFQGKPIKTLSISRVAFWNKGRELINGSDVSKNDPLKIICNKTSTDDLNNAQILDVRLISTNNQPSQPSIALSNGEGYINFDYFDKNQGCVIQIVHTGLSSKNLTICGTLKGCKPLNRFDLSPQSQSAYLLNSIFENIFFKKILGSSYRRKIRALFLASIGIVYTLLGIALAFTPLQYSNTLSKVSSDEISLIMRIITSLTVLLMGLSTLVYGFIKWKGNLPKGLESFEDPILS